MDKGKEKCEILKAIRAYVAEKYGLEYAPADCHHQGDCLGTCPTCDAELASLQYQLERHGITDITQDQTLSYMVEEYINTISQVPLTEGIPAPRLEGDVSFPEPEYEHKVILKCPVAGIGFHDIEDIWYELYVGAKLALVREKDNKYDKNAVAVALAEDYCGDPDDFDFDCILGYIPQKDNAAIAALLDMGWQDLLEAEVVEMKDHAPYSDKLHIAVYIRSKEPVQPKDDRLRMVALDDEDWLSLTDDIWSKGFAYFRWGGYPTMKFDLPEKGDMVVLLHHDNRDVVMYLMMTIATGDDASPFFIDQAELHAVDDCSPYVLTVVKGPIEVSTGEIDFLGDLDEYKSQPDKKLEKEISDRLLALLK